MHGGARDREHPVLRMHGRVPRRFSFLFFFALRCLVGYLEAGGMADRPLAWGGV